VTVLTADVVGILVMRCPDYVEPFLATARGRSWLPAWPCMMSTRKRRTAGLSGAVVIRRSCYQM